MALNTGKRRHLRVNEFRWRPWRRARGPRCWKGVLKPTHFAELWVALIEIELGVASGRYRRPTAPQRLIRNARYVTGTDFPPCRK